MIRALIRRLPASAFLFPLLLAATQARSYQVTPRPTFVKPEKFSAEAKPPEGQASDGLYWLLSDEQEDVAGHAHYRHYARKVLSAAGLEDVSEISIDFDPAYEKLAFHRITLWRKGVARELLQGLHPTWLRREEDWDDYGMLDGRKTLLFTLEDVRVGDIVEFDYTLRGDNPIFGDKASGSNDLQFGVPLDRLRLRIVHPAARPVHLTLRDAPRPALTRAGNDEIMAWSLAHVPARLDEDDAPTWYEPYPRVEWSEFGSWAEVVKWAEDLYAVREPLSPELRRFADSLRALEPRERIRRALRMVQDEVRYLGLEMGESSHKPAHPNVVYARRFGDCKDKALLFCTLMRELGLDAAPVLVNTQARAGAADYQPSPQAFDHVIARVVLDGKPYWFDATMSHQRGDPLASQSLPYGQGLAIVHGGTGFDAIGMQGAGNDKVEVRETLKVKRWDSTAVLAVTTTYYGDEAGDIRSQIAQDSRDQIIRESLNFHAHAFPHIRVLDSLRIDDDTAANRITAGETYAVDSLCARDATGRVGCAIYPEEAAQWVTAPERKIRSSPYALTYPKRVDEEITLELPERLAFASDRREIRSPDFSFAWDERQDGKRLKLAYAYAALADHVPLDRFPAYLRALDTIRANLGTTLYPGTGGWPSPDRLNFPLLFLCAGWLLAGIWAARALQGKGPGTPVTSVLRGSAAAVPAGFGPRLLGGWLAVGPFLKLAFFRDLFRLFDASAWNALTASHPWRAPALLAFICGEILLVCAAVGLWPLFFRRRPGFRKAFVRVSIAALLLRGADLLALAAFGGGFPVPGAWAGVLILGNMAVTGAWLTYALLSSTLDF